MKNAESAEERVVGLAIVIITFFFVWGFFAFVFVGVFFGGKHIINHFCTFGLISTLLISYCLSLLLNKKL